MSQIIDALCDYERQAGRYMRKLADVIEAQDVVIAIGEGRCTVCKTAAVSDGANICGECATELMSFAPEPKLTRRKYYSDVIEDGESR